MARDFSKAFEIVYDKFAKLQDASSKKSSVLAFGKFLGHGHDGRVKAWKGGQWPSAEDCWELSKILEIDLLWLVTGEGDPFPSPPTDAEASAPASAPVAEAPSPMARGLAPIPLVGFAKCGADGWHGTMHIPVMVEPPDWHADLIAVAAEGESMLPAGIGHGHICICDPRKTPGKGDAVYVETLDAKATIKLFCGRTDRGGKAYYGLQGWMDKKPEEPEQKPFNLDVLESFVRVIAPVVSVRRRL